ncbi:MAG TPA: helix-turn-helix domain-containing protein, partial [Myxococcaceae bacterium]|nr:helix-turn-helix domain-containing protein [Myxococcaceae bacterium]
ATKIPESVISALEGGHVERLPARMYVVNFVRAYAGVIGLEPEETVLRYEETQAPNPQAPVVQTPAPPNEQELERRRQAKAVRQWVALVLAALVALTLIFLGMVP